MKQQLVEAVRQLPLNPLIEPASVPWWPPAIGWWILLLVSIIAVLPLWLIGYRQHLRPALRLRRQKRQLRIALEPLLAAPTSSAATDINTLLKTHLMILGHDHCKTLTGQEWLSYLAVEARLAATEAEVLQPLGEASYRAPARDEGERTSADPVFRKTIRLLIQRLSPQTATADRLQGTRHE